MLWLASRILSSNRPTIREKKWYWLLILNELKVTVVAAWRLNYAVKQQFLSHLEFRRKIAICLMKMPLRYDVNFVEV